MVHGCKAHFPDCILSHGCFMTGFFSCFFSFAPCFEAWASTPMGSSHTIALWLPFHTSHLLCTVRSVMIWWLPIPLGGGGAGAVLFLLLIWSIVIIHIVSAPDLSSEVLYDFKTHHNRALVFSRKYDNHPHHEVLPRESTPFLPDKELLQPHCNCPICIWTHYH